MQQTRMIVRRSTVHVRSTLRDLVSGSINLPQISHAANPSRICLSYATAGSIYAPLRLLLEFDCPLGSLQVGQLSGSCWLKLTRLEGREFRRPCYHVVCPAVSSSPRARVFEYSCYELIPQRIFRRGRSEQGTRRWGRQVALNMPCQQYRPAASSHGANFDVRLGFRFEVVI
jgi:hypothetical protein